MTTAEINVHKIRCWEPEQQMYRQFGVRLQESVYLAGVRNDVTLLTQCARMQANGEGQTKLQREIPTSSPHDTAVATHSGSDIATTTAHHANQSVVFHDADRHRTGQKRLLPAAMAKLEVRIKYCCCCGLNIATLLIALYSLCIYLLFLGLAAWSMWRINNGIPDPQPSTVALAQFNVDSNTIILVDPYFDTLGLYTEELKYSVGVRYPVLVINIIIFLIVSVSSILLLFALCLKSPWLMIPWICSVLLDVVRGFISCIMIFVLSGGDVRKIAVGVFFLGLQLFHISLILIVTAKFQNLLAEKRGISYKERSVMADSVNMYPALPSPYAYSSPTTGRRYPGPYQAPYGTYHPGEGAYSRVNKYPTYASSNRQVDYPKMPPVRNYSNHSSQYSRQYNYGMTM
uniref:MARVEL domain-containing protein n=1 Tax=Trichuris muris TaxID=70415 RepID=A0A5S6QQJ1_TRIMR